MKNDDLLNLATNFDWITPSWAILQDFWNRPVSRFGIQANVGFDRGDIRRVLKKRGVRSWGYVYNVAGDLIMLSVPKAQAAWANWVLTNEGVPVLYAPLELVKEHPLRVFRSVTGKEARLARWVVGVVTARRGDRRRSEG